MRLLFFSPRPFWPLDTGAKLRDYHLARQLAMRARVTYLSFGEIGAGAANPALADGFERVVTVSRPPGYTPAKLMHGLCGPVPVTVLNYTTGAMKDTLARLLAEGSFDAVQLESVHLAEYLPVIRQMAPARGIAPRIIVDWHNIESELMRRYSESAGSFPRRFYARATAAKLEACERKVLKLADAVCVPSQRERDVVVQWAPEAAIEVVENGVDAAHYREEVIEDACRERKVAPGAIVYVGSMDYHANIDAVLGFASEVWPRIHAQWPELSFQIVGRNPPASVRALSSLPRVEVTGSVPDVRPYYRHALAAVVPLRVGGGTRLKILEALAAGTPVISTALGAEGLDVAAGRDILLAESAGDFVAAIGELRSNAGRRAALVHHGRLAVRSRYDWPVIGAGLYEFHQGLAAPDPRKGLRVA